MKVPGWVCRDRSHQAVHPGAEPSAVGHRPLPRARSAVENDLRGLRAIRAGIRAGERSADPAFRAVLARRADRLLDELLSLRQRPV